MQSDTTFFADEDALYYIDDEGNVYKVDYSNYEQELLFAVNPDCEGMIFPFNWYSPGIYFNPSVICHYNPQKTDHFEPEMSRVYYKTGENLKVTVLVHKNSGLLQFSQNDLDQYGLMCDESGTAQINPDYHAKGKLIILSTDQDESHETKISLFTMDNAHYKRLMDHDILAMSPEEVEYVIFAIDGSDKVGSYMGGDGAYRRYITFRIYNEQTKQLEKIDKVSGSEPPDSIVVIDGGNKSGSGSYPIDEFIDRIIEIWDSSN